MPDRDDMTATLETIKRWSIESPAANMVRALIERGISIDVAVSTYIHHLEASRRSLFKHVQRLAEMSPAYAYNGDPADIDRSTTGDDDA